jgi:hypothetical protein
MVFFAPSISSFQEFITVQIQPFVDKEQCPTGQNTSIPSSISIVASNSWYFTMKVRRIVFIKEHINNNSIKP